MRRPVWSFSATPGLVDAAAHLPPDRDRARQARAPVTHEHDPGIWGERDGWRRRVRRRRPAVDHRPILGELGLHPPGIARAELPQKLNVGEDGVREAALAPGDLHAHFPMHLLVDEQQRTHERARVWWRQRWQGKVVDVISLVANYQGPGDTPSVTQQLMRKGNVGVALSVLYQPFDEMDLTQSYGARPLQGYFKDVSDQRKTNGDGSGPGTGVRRPGRKTVVR